MGYRKWLAAIQIFIILLIIPTGCALEKASSTEIASRITLPEPVYDSETSLEEALLGRRSVKRFDEEPITLQQLSQLLWAGQGISDLSGKRTAPSAGALYPLKVYVVIGYVDGITPGIYEYEPETHTLRKTKDNDQRESLAQAALNQARVSQGVIDIVITAIYEKTT